MSTEIEKKSQFIAIAVPINSEEEALEIIKQRKKKYADATHNVYAYTLGDGTLSRYSDDAEPQGTAGMPALNAIRMSGITDVCVVITRYFGGILLGAGGLVRAYGKSAAMGIESAHPIEMLYCSIYVVKCDYSTYGKLEYLINNNLIDLVITLPVKLFRYTGISTNLVVFKKNKNNNNILYNYLMKQQTKTYQ